MFSTEYGLITLTVYQYVHPGIGGQAAAGRCERGEVSDGYRDGTRGPDNRTPGALDLKGPAGEHLSE
ncbi:MAG TPA: hypothetical protein VN520_03830 [Streptomyces sp.]|uniref:hypothetical protein n=1 Tax=Streptomyces sp. TaxID=1931 RepID=UPI002C366B22|nr:hypothetical protein [Streptomyces sp.]HWU05523.1 hypothetical protein [Streptomyces sp.]